MNYNGKFPIVEFNETKRLNPYWSDYICFAETVKKRKFLSPKIIRKYFDKLVGKDDYAKSEKAQVLQHLISLASREKKRAVCSAQNPTKLPICGVIGTETYKSSVQCNIN